jgi:hypothetical protein
VTYHFIIGLVVLALTSAIAEARDCRPIDEIQPSPIGIDNSIPQFEPEPTAAVGNSSFRGLSLGSRLPEAEAAVQRFGLNLQGHSADQKIICRGQAKIGVIRFDEDDKIRKLELSPAYFAVGHIVLREFADGVFRHYKVRSLGIADDVCYQDVTCFRGVSPEEQFLILRIAGDVQVHVSPRFARTHASERMHNGPFR